MARAVARVAAGDVDGAIEVLEDAAAEQAYRAALAKAEGHVGLTVGGPGLEPGGGGGAPAAAALAPEDQEAQVLQKEAKVAIALSYLDDPTQAGLAIPVSNR